MKYLDPECDFTADPHTPRAEGWASLLDRSDVLIIDCEAAGIGRDAEVTEIAVLNTKGEVVLNTYTLPEGRSAEDAIASTTDLRAAVKAVGIDAAWRDVLAAAGARHWPDVYNDLCKVLRDASVVLAYNAAFDKRLVSQTTERQIGFGLPHVNWRCLMFDYARWRGETDKRGRHRLAANADYRRYTLEDAYAREVSTRKQEHRALADCHLALGLMRAVVASGKGRGPIATVAKRVNAPPETGALSRLWQWNGWGVLAVLSWIYGSGALYFYLMHLHLWPPDWMGGGWISVFAAGFGYLILSLGGFWTFGKIMGNRERAPEREENSSWETL